MLQIKKLQEYQSFHQFKSLKNNYSKAKLIWKHTVEKFDENTTRIAELWLKHLKFQLLLSCQYLLVLFLDFKLIAGLYGQY